MDKWRKHIFQISSFTDRKVTAAGFMQDFFFPLKCNTLQLNFVKTD